MSAMSTRREFAKGIIDLALRKGFALKGKKARKAFAHLLWSVQTQSDLLSPGQYVGRARVEDFERIVDGLLALLELRFEWIRPVEEWSPGDSPPMSLFSSLAHHLFANYPVPPILLSAWFAGSGWQAQRSRRWFLQTGLGKSLRTIGIPIDFTRRMAHEFANSPAHLPILFAVRRAQVLGLGGTEELARLVGATRLGWAFGDDEFWSSVILLFRNTPRLDAAQVQGIVEYLHAQKFEHQNVIIGDETEITLDPPQPDFSIKGRTVASLMRQVEAWRAEAKPPEPVRRQIRWERSDVGEYRCEDSRGHAWAIRELLDSDALAAEGKAMQHCVADYTVACSKRVSTIWSMEFEADTGWKRLVTIEVDPKSRNIVQASMKCNESPDEACLAVLKEWATTEQLELAL
ncbi:PcfJ domain-containing protein [Singulisphaera rosea]